ncbi:hypothetical protein [Luteimicrobium sp. DT211]|uniref:hypothetical protein n=1 Tax=Luteimicrobium sp. DT211 TaxID=3393412 RepID=UPI003CF0F3FF
MYGTTRRLVAAATAGLLGVAGLTVIAGPASAADPVTSTASLSTTAVSAHYSDTTVSPGDHVTLTLTFQNNNGDPKSVSYALGNMTPGFSDVFTLDGCSFPTGVTLTSCEVIAGGAILSVGFSSLPPKYTTVTVDLTVKPDAATGTYPYQQSLVDTVDPHSTTSFSPALSITVQPPAAADLGLSLAADAGPLLTSQITYSLSVHNSGPGAATASTVQVALPSQAYSVTGLPTGCTYASSTDVVTCATGAIANGATKNVSFKANLGLLSLGSLPATASLVSSTPADPNAANNTSSITCTTLTSLIISCPATEL